MAQIELLDSTENEQVDRLWRGVIGIFETVFPDRVSAYYVTGSYANGSAIPTSDVDGAIVFKGDFVDHTEYVQAWNLLQHCSTLAPLKFDCILARERLVFFYGSRFVKFNSKLLYGTDIRDRIELRQPEFDARVPISKPFYSMARARGMPDTLVAPLDFPDPDGEFYGYDYQTIRMADGTELPSIKAIPVGVGWCATTLLDRAGVLVESKQDCLGKYRRYIGDEWTPFLEEVDIKIRQAWHYLIPEGKEERKELRGVCERTLYFENHYLSCLRGYLLEELDPKTNAGWWMPVAYADWYGFSVEEVQQATHNGMLETRIEQGLEVVWIEHFFRLIAFKTLGKFIFSGDDALHETIEHWVDVDDLYVRTAAREALQIQRGEATNDAA
ncbi:MAG: nucleotidyltransferase domain-containing protein [Chloroflexota bacterium]